MTSGGVEDPGTLTPQAEAAVHTFLIADVRGYTRFTTEEGDEAAARLAAEFARVAREAVAVQGGEVIELRGDEALAVFASSRRALRAAAGLQGRLAERVRADPSLPLRAGIGLDAGEAIPLEGGYRGAALNRAARLCSLAAAGEVLVTDGVVHLAGRLDGVEYVERGEVQLKGFATPVKVMEVRLSERPSPPGPLSRGTGEGETARSETLPSPFEGEGPGVRGLPIGGFLGSLPSGVLVGREAELKRALAAVDEVSRGHGQVVLLAGEPGAGKTRLGQEVTLQLRDRDFLVAAGRCYEAEQSVPYYPFLDALTDVYRLSPPDLQAAVPRRWPYLGAILRDEIGVPEVAGGAGEDERQWVLRAVTGFLEAVAQWVPVALLLDDLHWADSASLALVLHIARHTRSARVLILGTYRDVEVGRQQPGQGGLGLESALREIQREGLAERIAIRRLPQEGTRGLIAVTMGEEDISDEFTQLVHSRTDGNPFFVQHVLRVLVERGDVFQRDGRWDRKSVEEIEVPESVRSVIGQRLSRLREETQDVLHAASVLGQTFQFEELQEIGELGERELEDALDEAIEAGLVRDDGRAGYSFDHALTQQSLYAELSTRRKRRLHLAAGEALEKLPERKRDTRIAELAWHFLQGDDPEQALPWTLLAGDRAEAVFAHDEAERQYRTALELAREMGDREREAEALLKVGTVVATLARYDEAIGLLEEAASAYRTLGDREREAMAMAGIGWAYSLRGSADDGLRRLHPFVDTLGREGAAPSPGVGAAYAALANLCFRASRHEEELRYAERAGQIARAVGDDRLLARVEIERGTALATLGRARESLPVLEAAVDLADRLGDMYTLQRGLNNIASSLWDLQQFPHAEPYARRSLEAAERAGDPSQITWSTGMIGVYPMIRGEWDEALIWFERAAEMARGQGPSSATFLLTAPALVRMYRGEDEYVGRLAEECLALAEQWKDDRLQVVTMWVLGENHWLQGRFAKAVDALHPFIDFPGIRNDDQGDNIDVLAKAYLELGNETRARKLVARAETIPQDSPWTIVETRILKYILLGREGQVDEARAEYEETLDVARRLDYPYGEALTLSALGGLRSYPMEEKEWKDRLEAALAIFQRIGAKPLIERTQEALESGEAREGSPH
jgi:class 3 adenylate cyclase/tetratricopeptide (TPR) repeat protein